MTGSTQAVERIRAQSAVQPKTALVLGSGLGGVVDAVCDGIAISYSDLPGFPVSTVTGHSGTLVTGTISGTPVAVLSGRSHYYEHGRADAMRPVLETLKALGVDTVILTNSAGSVRADMTPGSVMLITDHINFSGLNPLIGEPSDARFVSMTAAYDPDLAARARAAAETEVLHLHEGVYAWFPGPSFETPAEIRAARVLGADAVGMSTVPEVILARFFGIRVLAFSVITNMAAGMTGADLSHTETKEMAPVGGAKLTSLLKRLLTDIVT